MTARPTGGYTLIELTVVMAIMAIAATVVGPELFRRAENETSAAVRQLQDAYGAARTAAVSRGGSAVVRVSLATGEYAAITPSIGRAGWDTLAAGRLDLGEVRLDGPTSGFALARFDALGRGRGDEVELSGSSGTWIVSPREWTGGSHVVAH